jgi:hypothetical protein
MTTFVEGEGSLSLVGGTDGTLMSMIGGAGLVVIGGTIRLGTRGGGLRHVFEEG